MDGIAAAVIVDMDPAATNAERLRWERRCRWDIAFVVVLVAALLVVESPATVAGAAALTIWFCALAMFDRALATAILRVQVSRTLDAHREDPPA